MRLHPAIALVGFLLLLAFGFGFVVAVLAFVYGCRVAARRKLGKRKRRTVIVI